MPQSRHMLSLSLPFASRAVEAAEAAARSEDHLKGKKRGTATRIPRAIRPCIRRQGRASPSRTGRTGAHRKQEPPSQKGSDGGASPLRAPADDLRLLGVDRARGGAGGAPIFGSASKPALGP